MGLNVLLGYSRAPMNLGCVGVANAEKRAFVLQPGLKESTSAECPLIEELHLVLQVWIAHQHHSVAPPDERVPDRAQIRRGHGHDRGELLRRSQSICDSACRRQVPLESAKQQGTLADRASPAFLSA